MFWICGYVALVLLFLCSVTTAKLLCGPVKAAAEKGRIGCIDGLRGYLALAVMGTHFLYLWQFAVSGQWTAPSMPVFHNLGAVAVTCFFMITGLLFYRRVVLDRRPIDWRGLYVGRVFRLYPAYLIAVAAVFIIAIVMSGRLFAIDVANLKAAAAWLLFTMPGPRVINGYAGTNYIIAGVTWTLCYEWAFYLALPAIALVMRPIARPVIRAGVLIAATIAVFLSPDYAIWRFSSHIAGMFLFGMLTAEIIALERVRNLLARQPVSVIGFLALCLAFAAAEYSGWQGVFIFVFFVTIASGNSWFGTLRAPAALLLGDASYGIYLLHGIVLFVVTQISGGWLSPMPNAGWILLPVGGILTVLLAHLVHIGAERPLIGVGKTLTRSPA